MTSRFGFNDKSDDEDLNSINENSDVININMMRSNDQQDDDYIEPEAVEMMDDEDEEDSSSSSSSSSSNSSAASDDINMNNGKNFNDQYPILDRQSKTNTNESEKNDNLNNNNFMIEDETDDRKRFQIELEFVQSLANPNYLNFLAQRGYFRNQTFLNYLKYLMYWKEPQYCKYLDYPQCLALLELLQHEQFLKEIVNAQCGKYVDEQLLLIWLNYKKRHDWKRFDPTKIPKSVENLIKINDIDFNNQNTPETEDIHDYYSANKFVQNEKF